MLKNKVRGQVGLDIPNERVYNSREDAELDEALLNAVNKAEAAGKSRIAKDLRHQLGSFYLRNRSQE